MNDCDEIQERLQDYLDGELSPELAEKVAAHAGSCLACRRELMALRELVTEARKLARSVEPERELWPGIEARLQQRGRQWARSGSIWSALAAATLATVVVGGALWLRTPSVPGVEPGPPAIGVAARADQARSEDGTLQVRRDLLGELERQRDRLDPETIAVMEEGAREIDHAIGEIRRELDHDPDDPDLNRLLAERYRQEMDLLRRIARA